MPRLPPVTSTDLLNAGPPVGFGPVRGTLSATDRYAESPPRRGGDLDDLDKLDHPRCAAFSPRSAGRSSGKAEGAPTERNHFERQRMPPAGVRSLVLEAEPQF